MLTFYNHYKSDITSQNGENGVIEEILKRIWNPTKGTVAVEFGAPTKQYCSNIYSLPDIWSKFYFDIDPKEPGITKAEITTENVNGIIPECFLLSIDIDNDDYHIWNSYKGNPAIVVIEINSSFKPPAWEMPGDKGSSYMAMLMLGISKGYFLVCHTGNLIFVKKEYRNLFPDITGNGFDNWYEYFNTQFLNQ